MEHAKRLCAKLSNAKGYDPFRTRAGMVYSKLKSRPSESWVCADCHGLPPVCDYRRDKE